MLGPKAEANHVEDVSHRLRPTVATGAFGPPAYRPVGVFAECEVQSGSLDTVIDVSIECLANPPLPLFTGYED